MAEPLQIESTTPIIPDLWMAANKNSALRRHLGMFHLRMLISLTFLIFWQTSHKMMCLLFLLIKYRCINQTYYNEFEDGWPKVHWFVAPFRLVYLYLFQLISFFGWAISGMFGSQIILIDVWVLTWQKVTC